VRRCFPTSAVLAFASSRQHQREQPQTELSLANWTARAASRLALRWRQALLLVLEPVRLLGPWGVARQPPQPLVPVSLWALPICRHRPLPGPGWAPIRLGGQR
jgi:hypothetical protein